MMRRQTDQQRRFARPDVRILDRERWIMVRLGEERWRLGKPFVGPDSLRRREQNAGRRCGVVQDIVPKRDGRAVELESDRRSEQKRDANQDDPWPAISLT
jgi:hypothetical protein